MEDFTMGDLQQAVAEYMENIDVPSDVLSVGGKIYVVVEESDTQSSYYNCVETVTSVCTLFTYIMVILTYLKMLEVGDTIIIYVPPNSSLNWMTLFADDSYIQINRYAFVVQNYLAKYLVYSFLLSFFTASYQFVEKR
jgi:hypothetical protein